jgi:uncharacterized membrane protein YfcA
VFLSAAFSHPSPLRDALTLVAGVGTGVLSAMFGVGGAIVSTPAIRVLGASAALAVGSTLPSVIPSAVTGTAHYARAQLINWRVVMWTAPAGIGAAVGGALLSKVVPGHGHWLMVLTAGLIGFSAWRMWRQERRAEVRAAAATGAAPAGAVEAAGGTAKVGAGGAGDDSGRAAGAAGPRRASPTLLVAIGAGSGLLSGLLGIGGGVVMVPAFTELARIPLKSAIATSLACVGIFAIPGTITHTFLGDIDWHFAVWLAIGVIPGARLGAKLALRASDKRLRFLVAVFLGIVSLIYAGGEIAALFR